MKSPIFSLLFVSILTLSCSVSNKSSVGSSEKFPAVLTNFQANNKNPVFKNSVSSTWDHFIRERGYILVENGIYHLWYTGYPKGEEDSKQLGYATSNDGVSFHRYSANPVYSKGWVEDVCVVKSDATYYMFAEGKGDTAHMLTSTDRINWTEQGNLDIRQKNGQPITIGPFGTPTIWHENKKWYLFSERGDLGVWLATSTDTKQWINLQDEPVLKMGPQPYDAYAVAMDQVIKYKGRYYAYYHASAFQDWKEWSTNIAMSEDLIHWEKFAGNPILGNNKSSGIVVKDGDKFRLYTMHPEVNLYLPAESNR